MPAIDKAIDAAGGVAPFARAIGVSDGFVRQLLCGSRRLPAARCIAAERATDGRVTRYQLRPDVFGRRPPQPK